ncbi:MAG: hypothetical protein N2055_04615 [Tepidimonas taiwanensis]|nr:hypothetical protein [Tepidimonas taiwanensis]
MSAAANRINRAQKGLIANAESQSIGRKAEQPQGTNSAIWELLLRPRDAVMAQRGYSLALELIQGKRELMPLLQIELGAAAITGDASRASGFLDGVLAAVESLVASGASVNTQNPVTRHLLSIGPQERRALLPWLRAEEGVAVLRDFVELARWVGLNCRVNLVKKH